MVGPLPNPLTRGLAAAVAIVALFIYYLQASLDSPSLMLYSLAISIHCRRTIKYNVVIGAYRNWSSVRGRREQLTR